MSLMFWMFCGLMLVIAVAFILLVPRWWQHAQGGESTADWVRLRKRELEGAEGLLLDEVDLRALEDLGTDTQPTEPVFAKPMALWWVPVLLLVAAVGLYRELGNLEDVVINDLLVNLDPESPDTVLGVIDRIEARVVKRPENLDYLSLLGQYYAAQGDHASAQRVYEQMLLILPENPEVLGRAAQAEFLGADRALSERARLRAEAALAIDPEQRAALGTLGMAAFEAEDYVSAVGYWERMLALEPPGTPGYQMMAQVIAQARERAGMGPTDAEGTAAGAVGIRVRVEVPADADIDPAASVFVLARPSGATSRMPTAVVRRSAATWPLEIQLTDAEAMAGQQISVLESVEVEVQVSPSGQPGLANATWYAKADNVVPSQDAAVTLKLAPAP